MLNMKVSYIVIDECYMIINDDGDDDGISDDDNDDDDGDDDGVGDDGDDIILNIII